MRLQFIGLFSGCLLAACGGGGDGTDGAMGTNGTNGLTARIAVVAEAPGSNCTAGGNKITAGLDTNGNGVLDTGEVASTQYVCNGLAGAAGLIGLSGAAGASGATGPSGAAGSSGFDTLVAMSAEPAGTNCASGGRKISVGLDSNRSGVLDAAEVTSSSYVCNGSAGAASTAAGLNSLVALSAEPAGANCSYGGSRIVSGLDGNANNTLDASEITATSYLCKSVATLVAIGAEAAGVHCANGGSVVTAGLDANANGALDAAEVSSTQYACNGAAGVSGAAGPAGSNGFDALVTMSAEAAGANCASGGKKVSAGLDTNRNGVLDPTEVASSGYVCSGAAGASGSNGASGASGLNSLIALSAEAPGTHCAYGGNRLTSGLDANRNGALDAGEVAATSYVCNGPPGASVAWERVTVASVQAQPNSAYLLDVNDPLVVTLILPVAPPVGSVVRVVGAGSARWSVAQNAGQTLVTKTLDGRVTPGPMFEGLPLFTSIASSADGSKLVAAATTLSRGPDILGEYLYTSTDYGATWVRRADRAKWTAVASSADGSHLVAAASGTNFPLERIYTSADSGATWVPGTNLGIWSSVASSADGSKLVASNRSGGIYTSTDFGVTWTARETNLFWKSVASSADGVRLIAAASDPQNFFAMHLFTSADSGVTWTQRGEIRAWGAVASSADGRRLVATEKHQLLDDPNNDVYPIYMSSDFGVTWTADLAATSGYWQSLAMSASGDMIAAIETNPISNGSARVFTSSDFGANWISRYARPGLQGSSIASSADGYRLAFSDAPGSLSTLAARTETGVTGWTSGGRDDALEIIYSGNGVFTVIDSSGTFIVH